MGIQLSLDHDKWLPNNKLRRIATASPVSSHDDHTTHYVIEMQPILHDFHPRITGIPMWSFGKTSPGEIIEAEVGKPVRVTWLNLLANQNLKTTLDLGTRQGMEEDHMLAVSHNQIHLHGARVPWTSDGFPDHVFHPNEGRIYYYPNSQAAAMLWYHDHAMDVTRLNVYAGLFGAYILRDPLEATVLPSGHQEIALILQDKSFSDDGTKLHYEQGVEMSTSTATPEFIGTSPLVNGQIWPLLEVHPRIYRLRLLNGANTRFFNLSLTSDTNISDSLTMYVIGSDGGFLDSPVPVTEILLAPGERADVLVDLRCQNKNSFILRNNAPVPYSGDPSDSQYQADDYLPLAIDDAAAELLKITVHGHPDKADDQFDPTSITLPKRIDPQSGTQPPPRASFAAIEAAINLVPIDVLEAYIVADGVPVKLRRIKLEEHQLFMNTLPGIRVPTVLVNGESYMTAPMHATSGVPSATVDTQKDAIEVWEFINVTPDTHPMHLHLVQFQLMSRIRLDVVDDPDRVSDSLPEPKKANGYLERKDVAEYEMGWKDTVRCNPSQSTRVMVCFNGYSGNYVYHCHILEHEDMGMMCRLNVE